MIESTANIGLVFMACILLSLLYWQIVYPVILRRLRFKLFEIRDDLRRLGTEQHVGDTKTYGELEGFICSTIRFLPAINITSFLWFILTKHQQIKDEIPGKDADEPTEFNQLRLATSRIALAIMAINSPWMVFLSLGIGIVCFTLGTITRLQLYKDAESFVEVIPQNAAPDLQAA